MPEELPFKGYMRLSSKIQGQKPTSAERSFLFMSHSCAECLRESLRVKEGRGGQESFKGMEIIDCLWGIRGWRGYPSPGLWQTQLAPHECQGCFGGVRGEERKEVTTSCTGCDQNVRKSKKYVPQEGNRGFWYNESNRHLSKSA